METKVCTKCGRELPLSMYTKDKKMKSGLKNVCKDCCYEAVKRYVLEHKEETKVKRRIYYIKNKDKFAAHNAEYYENHKKYSKRYYAEQTEIKRELRNL